MDTGKFGTAINCIDGQVQLPVINWMKDKLGLDYVDMITEPGADKAVAAGWYERVEAIKKKARNSVKAHGSRVVIVAGHDDCTGNPVTPEQHKTYLRNAFQTLVSWDLPLDRVMAVWIDKDGKFEVIASS